MNQPTARNHASRVDLFQFLDDLDIRTSTIEHEAVFTVAESDRLERNIVGGHTKNLFLKDAKGQLFLVIAQSHTEIDLKTLHKTLGAARFSFGKAELLMEVLGVPPGSVTAFSVINDRSCRVRVVVDAALMGYDLINCHPLTNTATTTIGRDDLFKFIRATGHEPRVAALAQVLAGTASD
ncbi:MAG: prolyl-tRNA synthetase associated domain-containing protein [Hyphomicrobiaceae bacterium]|nr:prolyl-tRNA synthetase associated domain-containing protein [Hyphomicrobiaceae bacterium]